MKRFLVTSAAAAALFAAPVFAQVVTALPVATPDVAAEAEATTEGQLRIEGVEPSRVLGAIDTSKLVEEQPPVEAEPEVQADAEIAADTTTDAQIAAATDIEVSGELPQEVAEVVADGDYNTADLVEAQLAAVQNAPISNEIETTTTITQPDADESAPEDDNAG